MQSSGHVGTVAHLVDMSEDICKNKMEGCLWHDNVSDAMICNFVRAYESDLSLALPLLRLSPKLCALGFHHGSFLLWR
jgi:hypothetical protein